MLFFKNFEHTRIQCYEPVVLLFTVNDMTIYRKFNVFTKMMKVLIRCVFFIKIRAHLRPRILRRNAIGDCRKFGSRVQVLKLYVTAYIVF